jgi:hypothetical protein
MKIYKNYVLAIELCKRAKISRTVFNVSDKFTIEKMGSTAVLNKDLLPSNYKKYAQECLDLGAYYTAAALSEELGVAKSYFYVISNSEKRELQTIKIHGKRLILLPEELLDLLDSGYTPYRVKDYEDQLDAELIINFCGLKLGFYK